MEYQKLSEMVDPDTEAQTYDDAQTKRKDKEMRDLGDLVTPNN